LGGVAKSFLFHSFFQQDLPMLENGVITELVIILLEEKWREELPSVNFSKLSDISLV
jgi:hypothetical protein